MPYVPSHGNLEDPTFDDYHSELRAAMKFMAVTPSGEKYIYKKVNGYDVELVSPNRLKVIKSSSAVAIHIFESLFFSKENN